MFWLISDMFDFLGLVIFIFCNFVVFGVLIWMVCILFSCFRWVCFSNCCVGFLVWMFLILVLVRVIICLILNLWMFCMDIVNWYSIVFKFVCDFMILWCRFSVYFGGLGFLFLIIGFLCWGNRIIILVEWLLIFRLKFSCIIL